MEVWGRAAKKQEERKWHERWWWWCSYWKQKQVGEWGPNPMGCQAPSCVHGMGPSTTSLSVFSISQAPHLCIQFNFQTPLSHHTCAIYDLMLIFCTLFFLLSAFFWFISLSMLKYCILIYPFSISLLVLHTQINYR